MDVNAWYDFNSKALELIRSGPLKSLLLPEEQARLEDGTISIDEVLVSILPAVNSAIEREILGTMPTAPTEH
jgi:hypothetical protein